MTDAPEPAATPNPSWESQLEAAAQDGAPARRNGFDAARKKTFLKALAKGATLSEAAKAACVARSTVYAHQKEDPRFAAECVAAVKVTAPVVELAAFDRAVTGVEEDVIHYGKYVGTRVKRSDALLQTLLKGSNPEKYGPQAGVKRKGGKKLGKEALLRLRQEIRAEIEQEIEDSREPIEQVRARLARRIKRAGDAWDRERIAKGYVRHAETNLLVPPGWTIVPTGQSGNEHVGRPICPASSPGGVPFIAPTR